MGKKKSKKVKRVASRTSKFQGATWNKRDKKWRARIQWQKKSYFLGTYADEKEAIKAVAKFKKSKNIK